LMHQSLPPNLRAHIHQPIARIFMSNTLNLIINSDKSDKPTLKKPLQAVPSPLKKPTRWVDRSPSQFDRPSSTELSPASSAPIDYNYALQATSFRPRPRI
jgi:hypothetical protein